MPQILLAEACVGFTSTPDPSSSYVSTPSTFGVLPFTIATGNHPIPPDLGFSMTAPTTNLNLSRVVRAMQLSKPVLLEGSPGVGKTSLIQALAAASGHKLVRINLSEQTDIGDLMGSDLPVPSDSSSSEPKFSWCDGIFLKALKAGDWVLLDELNLASQTVLEGLNSTLDHRAQVYIPELSKTFDCPPTFRVFAAQNPLSQGGGRKGLPKSFLNRFTKVFVEALTPADLHSIVSSKFPTIEPTIVTQMIDFNNQVQTDIVTDQAYGQLGSPWEFNLRDVFRWCHLAVSEGNEHNVALYVDAIYLQRMRSESDRAALLSTFNGIFSPDPSSPYPFDPFPDFDLTSTTMRIGTTSISRCEFPFGAVNVDLKPNLPRSLRRPLETIARSVNMNWPCLLIGPMGSGKSTLIRTLSKSCNVQLEEAAMTPATDVTELLGCFEQCDSESNMKNLLNQLNIIIRRATFLFAGLEASSTKLNHVLNVWWSMQLRKDMAGGGLGELADDETFLNSTSQLLDGLGYLLEGNQELQEAFNVARGLFKVVQAESGKGRGGGGFHWVDGVLVKAMEEGKWLHLENVNFCPSSVLDRLNPLMEIGGSLVLTEGGGSDSTGARVIHPHPNFRLFLSMNAETGGEVSRAMRNRCIEVSLIGGFGSELPNIPEGNDLDIYDELSNIGVEEWSIAETMLKVHRAEIGALEMAEDGGARSLKPLFEMATLYVDLVRRGKVHSDALDISWRSCYRVIDSNATVGVVDNDSSANLPLLPVVSLTDLWLSYPNRARVYSKARLLSYLSAMAPSCSSLPVLLKTPLKYLSELPDIGEDYLSGLFPEVLLHVAAEFVRNTTDFDFNSEMWVAGSETFEMVSSIAASKSASGRLEMEYLWSTLLSATPPDAKGLTPVAMSAAISQNKIGAEYAENNNLIVILCELFESFDRFVERLGDDADKAKGVLEARDDIFLYLNSFPSSDWFTHSKDYLDPRFLVYWRWILKSYSNGGFEDLEFERILKRVNRILAGNGGGGVADEDYIIFGSDLLYKYGGHPLICRTEVQAMAKSKLEGVGGSLVGHKHTLNLASLVGSNDPVLFTDAGFKRELLMALCTLHFQATDEASSSSSVPGEAPTLDAVQIIEGLIAKAAKLRLNFEHSLNKATIDLEIRTVENNEEAYRLLKEVQEGAGLGQEAGNGQEVVRNLMTRFATLQTTPLIDFWSVHEESIIIGLISAAADLGALVALVERIKNWIKISLKGDRNIAIFRPYQTLIWSLQSSLPHSAIKRLLSLLLPTMISGNFRDSWTNSYDELNRLSAEIASPIFWGVESADGVVSQLSDNASSAFSGIARLDQSIISPAISRLMTSSGDWGSGCSTSVARFTLENASARQNQGKELVKILSSLSTPSRSERGTADMNVIRRMTRDILSAFAVAEGGKVWDGGKLEGCKDVRFSGLLETVIRPLLEIVDGEGMGEEKVAESWVYLGLLNLHLSLPSTPLDPALKPAAKAASILSKLKHLGVKGEVKRWLEVVENGGGEEFELEGWERSKGKLERQKKKVVCRLGGGAGFKGLYYESWSYARSLGSVDTVISVLRGSQNEENWQEATSEFLERLKDGYEGYEDMAGVEVGVGCIRKGLRLRRAGGSNTEDEVGGKAREITKILLEYPYNFTKDWHEELGGIVSEACMKELGKEVGAFMKKRRMGGSTAKQTLGVQMSVLFAVLCRASLMVRVNNSLPSVVTACFGNIVSAWIEAERLRKEEEEEEGKEEGEEEREERLLREQFPDFSKEYMDIVHKMERRDEEWGDDDDEEGAVDGVRVDSSFSLSEEQVEMMCEMHRTIFAGKGSAVDDRERRAAFGWGYEAASRMLCMVEGGRDGGGMDRSSVGGNLMGVGVCGGCCRGVVWDGVGGRKPGFNEDPNPGEVLKAEGVLERVVLRVTALLRAFPGHSVLLTIGQVSAKVRIYKRRYHDGVALVVTLKKVTMTNSHLSPPKNPRFAPSPLLHRSARSSADSRFYSRRPRNGNSTRRRESPSGNPWLRLVP